MKMTPKKLYLFLFAILLCSTAFIYLFSASPKKQQQNTSSSPLATHNETRFEPDIEKNSFNQSVSQENKVTQKRSESLINEGDDFALQDHKVVGEYIDELISMNSGTYDFKKANETKQALLQLAKRDNAALNELLLTYTENLDDKKLEEELFQVLSQVKNPRVEAIAHELTQSSSRNAQIAGFELLGELKIPSEQNLNLALNTLSQGTNDKELTLSALHALTKIPLSSEENANVIETLSELTRNQDEAVRSESILTTSQWAKNEDDLSAVIAALESDTVDDKISAAMALERSPVVGERLKATLLATIKNDDELWEVRSMSANALGRFDLSASEFAVLEAFRSKQQGGVPH